MENRTVDNLFAAYYGKNFPGGGTWDSALDLSNPNAQPTLSPFHLNAHFDPSHLHDVGWNIESQGLWNNEPLGCNSATTCPAGATAFADVPMGDTDIYRQLITNWAFVNNVLQANEGPSFVAHQYYIAAQSGGIAGAPSAPDAEAENPHTPYPSPIPPGNYQETSTYVSGDTAGCNGPAYMIDTVNMSLPHSNQNPDNGTPLMPACEEYNTILDEIGAGQGTPPVADWQYIASTDRSIWAAPLGVSHLYQQYLHTDKADEPFAVDPDAENFVLNITGSTSPAPNPVRPFASLTYITPCANESDHPIMKGNADGPQWLGWIVNAIGNSKYWNSTAIIVTWDDWGGFYDKEPFFKTGGQVVRPFPNAYGNHDDPNEWGFRVPMIVISPYIAHPAFVSNQATSHFAFRSQSVILQFIESHFNLPSLNGDDGQQGQIDGLQDVFTRSSPLPYVAVTGPVFSPPPGGGCPNGNAMRPRNVPPRKPAHAIPRVSMLTGHS